MARIIHEAARVQCEVHTHDFEWRTRRGAGFSFPCAADGTLEDLPAAARDNWARCLDGSYDVVDRGVQVYRWAYTEPALLRCDCGATLALDAFTNTCRCGADYNMSGARLAPREQWGEETGETAAQILMGGANY